MNGFAFAFTVAFFFNGDVPDCCGVIGIGIEEDTGPCIGIWTGIWTGICIGICIGIGMDIWTGICPEICPGICICMDICMGICMGTDICIGIDIICWRRTDSGACITRSCPRSIP